MQYLLGLIGHPVAHSGSPPMHRAALAHYGLSGDYLLVDLPAERLAYGVADLVGRGFAGFNVTVPHKQAVTGLIGRLTPEASLVGAVNTVAIDRRGQTTGHNTDLGGFKLALSECWNGPPGGLAVVVGAGGAARAAVCGLLELGWPRVVVLARNDKAGRQLVAETSARLAAGGAEPAYGRLAFLAAGEPPPAADLLVNCTPAGLAGNQAPAWLMAAVAAVSASGLLFDMVYRLGGATPLVEGASRRRLAAVDGGSMLVYQAALAFNFWTGRAGPVEVMRQALAGAGQILQ